MGRSGPRVTGSVIDGLLAIDALTHRPMAVMVIHHTDCATAHFAAAQPDWPLGLDGSVLAAKAVVDPWATVASDVGLLRVRLPEGSLVRGYVYDVETGLVRVLRIVEAVDCGQVVNPHMAEGQVEGAALNGISYALTEEYLFDANGRMRNPGFRDYKIFSTVDQPKLTTILVESHEPTGPYGAKSVSLSTTSAVVISCVMVLIRVHSLSPTPKSSLISMVESASSPLQRLSDTLAQFEACLLSSFIFPMKVHSMKSAHFSKSPVMSTASPAVYVSG